MDARIARYLRGQPPGHGDTARFFAHLQRRQVVERAAEADASQNHVNGQFAAIGPRTPVGALEDLVPFQHAAFAHGEDRGRERQACAYAFLHNGHGGAADFLVERPLAEAGGVGVTLLVNSQLSPRFRRRRRERIRAP